MRRLKPTSIPTDAEIRVMMLQFKEALPTVLEATAARGLDPEVTVRFHTVAAQCQESRERLGKTLKETATALRVPQYRLREIESGFHSSLSTAVLER